MAPTTASTEKMHEALALLNEAARERREEIGKLLNEKYTHIRDSVSHAAHDSAVWMRDSGKAVDESAHKHPWYFVGGAAVIGLLLGFILGRKRD